MSAPAHQQQQSVNRPILHLELKKLARTDTSGGGGQGHDTPKSTRRAVSSKLSRYVNFFERSAFVKATTLDDLEGHLSNDSNDNDAGPIATQTARATLTTVKVSPRPSSVTNLDSADSATNSGENRLASVREIIKRFDSSVVERRDSGPLSHRSLRRGSSSSIIPAPPHAPPQRSATLQPVPSTTSAPSAPTVVVKWQQVEKKVAGAVVGKVWRRCETEVSQTNVNSPRCALSENSYDSEPPAKAETSFAPIGEGNEEDSVSSGSSPPSSRGAHATRAEPLPRKVPKADSASKTKRASHFVAIRIDDSEVVEAVQRFQAELTNSAPFLDHCRSNCNKLHLTLLVLSLGTAEIERAKVALVTGVRRFMTAKAAMLSSLKLGDGQFGGVHRSRRANGATLYNYDYNQSTRYIHPSQSSGGPELSSETEQHSCQPSFEGDRPGNESAFDLDFRTIGAFGTRVLFLSPPLRQRLLLQCFHVELARAFGDQGVPIVGAGSGWNSAMEIQKQVRGDGIPPDIPTPPLLPGPTSGPESQSMHHHYTQSCHSPVAAGASSRVPSPVQVDFSSRLTEVKTPLSPGSPPRPAPSQWDAKENTGTPIPKSKPYPGTPSVSTPVATPPAPALMMGTSGPYPEVATALDKALIRQYDLSSARTTLYIPQITLFKISKAAKRSKAKGATCPAVVPKLKLFPRLYHNLVQRVLQNGLPPPRPARREVAILTQQSTPMAFQPTGPYGGGDNPPNNDYNLSRGRTQHSLSQAQPALHCYAPPSSPAPDSIYAIPQHLYVYQIPSQSPEWPMGKYHPSTEGTYMSVVPQHLYSVAEGSGLFARSSSVDQQPQWVPSQYDYASSPGAEIYQSPKQQSYYGTPKQPGRPQYQSPMQRGYGGPGASMSAYGPPHAQSGRRGGNMGASAPPAHHRRLKIDKIVTTSQLPKPPFGTQPCCFVELLEMSQMDPDGYYRRICRVKLSQQAEILEEIPFQSVANKQQDEDTTAATESRISPSVDFV